MSLRGLFCRELFVAPADDDWVMFMRRLPPVRTALLNDTTRPSRSGELDGGTVSFNPGDFPMIERISCLDIRREELRGLQILLRGEGSLDRGSQAFQVRQASPGLSRHGSGDIHGSRPDPVSPPAGARSSPGAAHGHDPMSSRGSTAFQDLLPPGRVTAFGKYCARSPSQHRNSLPPGD